MSAFAHVTEVDQGGAVEDEVTDDHVGSPERLEVSQVSKPLESSESLVEPERSHIPTTGNSGFAYPGAQKAISSSDDDFLLSSLSHHLEPQITVAQSKD